MKHRKEAIRFVIASSLLLALGAGFWRFPTQPPVSPSEITKANAPAPPAEAPRPRREFSKPRTAAPGAESSSEATEAGPANPVLQEGLVTFQPPLKERVFAASPGEKKSLRVQLLGGETVQIDVIGHEVLDEQSGVIQGEAADEPGSHVLLAYVDDAVAGTMFFPKRGLFAIRYAGNGLHRVVQLDPNYSPPCGVGELPATTEPGVPSRPLGTPELEGDLQITNSKTAPQSIRSKATATLPGAPLLAADAPATTVDIFIAYSTAAKNANGGDSGIAALINSSIANANLAFNNGRAGVTLRLAGKVEVAYTDSGALTTDLPRLQNASDGYMDNVPVLRSNFKADLCSLIVHSGGAYAGLGYLWSPTATASTFAPWGFSVVVDAYADAYLTLAHEVGHNFGCGHAPGDGGTGAYAYSTGYRFTVSGTQYRTVMAYAPGTRIPYFSNPGVKYLGANTGHSTANNAQTILNSKAIIAGIQTGSSLYVEWSPLATTDLNADSKSDTLWRSSVSGRVVNWFMEGTNTTGTAALWSGDPAWTPVASADFNADAQPDLVWRNSTSGRVIVWFLNGTNTTGTAAIWSGDAAWVPVAAGDFNADGKPDLLWRNSSTGRVIVWFLNGVVTTGTAALWAGDPAWVPVAAGDFNADGKPDIVWRNSTTGRVVLWFMNGAGQTGTAILWSGDAGWVPVATGDFNSDGKPDLLWRHTASGRVVIWYLNGTTQTGTAVIWG